MRVSLVLVLAACNVSDDPKGSIEVEPNALGVASLHVDRFDDHGNQVVLVDAWSLDAQQLGFVRVVTSDAGSEVFASIAGHDLRMATRASQRIDLDPAIASSPTLTQFLTIATMSSVLEREANIVVHTTAGEQAYDNTSSCPPNYMLTSPVATQCCLNTGGNLTYFINAGTFVQRYRNPNGTGCKASDGVSSCSGTACYYGPAGFSAPGVYSGYTGIHNGTSNCYPVTPAPSPHEYPDITGTFPRGQGCPGGTSAPGYWDY